MSGILSEKHRQEFLATLYKADFDEATTGLFIDLLAPRHGGLTREAIVAAGELPLDLAERIAEQSRARLREHNEALEVR